MNIIISKWTVKLKLFHILQSLIQFKTLRQGCSQLCYHVEILCTLVDLLPHKVFLLLISCLALNQLQRRQQLASLMTVVLQRLIDQNRGFIDIVIYLVAAKSIHLLREVNVLIHHSLYHFGPLATFQLSECLKVTISFLQLLRVCI